LKNIPYVLKGFFFFTFWKILWVFVLEQILGALRLSKGRLNWGMGETTKPRVPYHSRCHNIDPNLLLRVTTSVPHYRSPLLKDQDSVSQQVCYDKDPFLLKDRGPVSQELCHIKDHSLIKSQGSVSQQVCHIKDSTEALCHRKSATIKKPCPKTETPCHSRCGTITILPCLKTRDRAYAVCT
jgi:hypothetical protein